MATIETKTTTKFIKHIRKNGYNPNKNYKSNYSDIAYSEDSDLFGKVISGKVIAFNSTSEWEAQIVLRNEDRGTLSIGTLYTPVVDIDIYDIFYICKEELNIPEYEIYDFIYSMAVSYFYNE